MGNTCLKDAATNPWISMKCIIIAKSSNINVSEVDGKRIEREKNPVVAVVGVVLKENKMSEEKFKYTDEDIERIVSLYNEARKRRQRQEQQSSAAVVMATIMTR